MSDDSHAPRRNPMQARQLLPREAYQSQQWFETEQEALFGAVWNYAGMVDDLLAPGDYLCTTAGPFPLFVVRGADGELRAFHNLCRHRGTRLLDRSGNIATGIRCPYHFWQYDMDGTLKSVPQERALFRGLDKQRLSLKPASVAQYRGLLFVHASAEPTLPFDAYLADLDESIGPHLPGDMVEFGRVRFRFRANWKLVVENYLDAYHLFYLHRTTAATFDHSQFEWKAAGRHYVFYEPVRERARASWRARFDGAGVPAVPGTDPDEFGGHFHMLFPNLGWVGTAYYWNSFHAHPVSPTETIVETRRRCMPMEPAALAALREGAMKDRGGEATLAKDRPISLDDCELPPTESGNLMYEDMWICERLQASLRSPAFEVGPMADHFESPLTFHQRSVADYLGVQSEP